MPAAVNTEAPGGIAGRWSRLSTGLKMLLILSLGLLPLGIIAVVASIDNAREIRERSRSEAQALLAVHVQRFTLALSRNGFTIRAGRDAAIEAGNSEAICKRTLNRLSRSPNTPGRFALYGDGPRPLCATDGFTPPAPLAPRETARPRIAPDGRTLQVFLYDPVGRIEGIAEYRREDVARAIDTPDVPGEFGLELVQGRRTMTLRESPPPNRLSDRISTDFPFSGGEFVMRLSAGVQPITLAGALIILTPVLMWLWASVIGWLLVQRLLLRPLERMRNVISAYKPGDRGLDLPTLRSPAREIGELGQAFEEVTRTVAGHEANLEAAVERQTRLVREVHHRVKNNLQVVASLLNLHARGSRTEEAAEAYASIQRRVDALAVVHRNHYAELEENRGVALRPLISELAANLRATAPPAAAGMSIRLDISPLQATQDVAVSVAFLITEVAEFGMLCGASQVSILLEREAPTLARLCVEVDSLAGGAVECEEAISERFERIITGLSRQLRSTLERDPERGLYEVRIAVVDT